MQSGAIAKSATAMSAIFISFLRAKVDQPKLPKLIHTERGVGYSIQEQEC
jgi:DNA-binding response OmpR family regulator